MVLAMTMLAARKRIIFASGVLHSSCGEASLVNTKYGIMRRLSARYTKQVATKGRGADVLQQLSAGLPIPPIIRVLPALMVESALMSGANRANEGIL